MLMVDGYNVLHAAGTVHEGLGGLSLPGLLGLIESSRWAGGPVLVVCDGTGRGTGIGMEQTRPDAPVRVVFAGPGKDADAAIERLVIEEERRGRAGRVVVVSSDKGVLASAIGPVGAKAKRMTSEQFVRALVEDAARAGGKGALGKPRGEALGESDVKEWVRRFGLEGDASQASRGEPRGGDPKSSGSESGGTQDWPDGIDPDDLDMGKWLKE